MKESNKHKHCNHHHELTNEQELVDFGNGEFVADKTMIPLLRAMNDAGLVTRTHCSGHGSGHKFIGIILDDSVSIDIRNALDVSSVSEHKGKLQAVIAWKGKP